MAALARSAPAPVPTLTTEDLADAVWEVTELPRHVCEKAVQGVITSMTEALGELNRIEIRGLGMFEIHLRPELRRLHPMTKKLIIIPSKKVVVFRPSQQIKDALNS